MEPPLDEPRADSVLASIDDEALDATGVSAPNGLPACGSKVPGRPLGLGVRPASDAAVTESAPTGPDVEARLVARLRAREEAAFEELVREHGHRMLSLARRFFGDDADAQDAVQDAFLSVHRAMPDFSGDSRLGTWLHRIVVNACLMKIRARKRRPEAPLDAAAPDGIPAYAQGGMRDGLSVSIQGMGRAETRARVRACIGRIPETYRAVLLLRDIEGMPIAEISQLLDVSAGTVKMRLHRARNALRQLLDPYMKENAS